MLIEDFIFCMGSPQQGDGHNTFAFQHHRKRAPIEILFYRGRRILENKTKENKRRILLSHRVFSMQRRW